jgi:DNA-3-methyladenine glycosylase II
MSKSRDDRAAERDAAHRHLLSADPAMVALARAQGPIDPYQRPRELPLHDGDLFEGLVFHIVGQSISERSALATFGRLRALLGGSIDSRAMAAAAIASLRAIGLSRAKSGTLSGLGRAVQNGELNLEDLKTTTDETVLARLTALPGVGPWTAQIFLLYELRRPDAFPAPEIGLRRAIGLLDGLAEPPPANIALSRAAGWRPYRSYAAAHLWRSLR